MHFYACTHKGVVVYIRHVAADAALPFLRMRREAEQKKNGEKSEKATICPCHRRRLLKPRFCLGIKSQSPRSRDISPVNIQMSGATHLALTPVCPRRSHFLDEQDEKTY